MFVILPPAHDGFECYSLNTEDRKFSHSRNGHLPAAAAIIFFPTSFGGIALHI